jgi:hypothetical protein
LLWKPSHARTRQRREAVLEAAKATRSTCAPERAMAVIRDFIARE